MELYAPDYYKDFKCIADKCTHSCCIGWEIDIDNDTLNYYNSLGGDMGKRLRDNISTSEEGAHFILSHNDRCPFLLENGLCDIILNSGEGALCQICADHPRYRNFFDSRTEIGLGLCCEEVCRLILSREEKTSFLKISSDNLTEVSDEEFAFFAFRQKVTDILQDRLTALDLRIEKLFKFCDISLPDKTPAQWSQIYLKLERLDEEWTSYLEMLNSATEEITGFENAFEQLIVYFINRHLADGFFDMRICERILLCVLSTKIIKAICGAYYCKYGKFEFENLIEIVRMYSSEIEYCEENIEALLSELI